MDSNCWLKWNIPISQIKITNFNGIVFLCQIDEINYYGIPPTPLHAYYIKLNTKSSQKALTPFQVELREQIRMYTTIETNENFVDEKMTRVNKIEMQVDYIEMEIEKIDNFSIYKNSFIRVKLFKFDIYRKK